MDEEDDFGDLYEDLVPGTVPQGEGLPGLGAGHGFYEDDEDEDGNFFGGSTHLAKEQAFVLPKPSYGFEVGDQSSDEDEALLLFGKVQEDKFRGPLNIGTFPQKTESNGFIHPSKQIVATGIENLGEESPESEGLGRVERVAANGVLSPETSKGEVPTWAAPVGEPKEAPLPDNLYSLHILERSPGADDLANHAAAIPGLSTNPIISQFAAENELLQEEWEGREAVGQHFTAEGLLTGEDGGDWDSDDSEDGLRIVLNDDHPMYRNFDRGADRDFEEGSEDEDGGLDIVAGDEPVDDQEWGEEPPLLIDGVQAVAGDKSLAIGGDRQGGPGDERVQIGKGPGLSQGVSRTGYGSHGYHNNYKYVRPGAASGGVITSGGQGLSSRVSLSKGGSGRGDWSGAGRGSHGSQRTQLPTWGSSASRGFQYGFEYNLPPNKTVFDIDLDSFDEKPWRHPSVDMSDFFNFGFNESSYKEYCKQLAQLRLESTMQSKIRVYESGRSQQEYDLDLPPELAAAAGLREASGESAQQRQTDTEAMAATGGSRGAGRGHIHVIPTGRAIQVEGGVGERRPSADIRRQRIRDSDAILLVDAAEDEPVKGQSVDDEIQVEEEEDTKVGPDSEPKYRLDLWSETGPPSEERGITKKSGLLSGANPQGHGLRPMSGFDGDRVMNFSAVGSGMQVGKPDIGFRLDLIPGEFSPPSTARHKTPRPLTPPGKTPTQEKRETEREQSHSSSMHEESQSEQEVQKNDGPHTSSTKREQNPECSQSMERSAKDPSVDDVSGGHAPDEGNRSSSREVIDQEDALNDSVHTSKRQRLGSPDELHAVLQNDFDLIKSSVESALKKDLDYDEDSSKVRPEDDEEEFRQLKGHHSTSREDKHLYNEDDAQSQKRSESVWHSRQELDRETVSHTVKIDEHRRRSRERVEFNRSKDQSMDRHGRGGDAQLRRRREEEARRDYLIKEEETKQKDRGHIPDRPDLKRKREEEGRRRDRLGRGGIRHREREEKPTNRHVIEDELHFRRSKEDSSRRRDKLDRVDGGREYREREKSGPEHRDRERETHLRQEESRRRDKTEDYRHRRGREDLWREREGTHQRKGLIQDMHMKRERDEERPGQVGRNRRLSEDSRPWLGHVKDEFHARESIRAASGDIDCIRERPKRDEHQGRDRDRAEHRRESEGRAIPRRDREDSHLLEEQITHQEKSSRERSFNKHNPSFDDGRPAEEQKPQNGRQKSDSMKGRELDNERNGASSVLADEMHHHDHEHQDASKRHRAGADQTSNQSGKVSRRSLDPVLGSFRLAQTESQAVRGDMYLENVRSQDYDSEAQNYFSSKEENPHVMASGSSGDEPEQRGRSKLERWTSQKVKENEAFRKLLVYDEKLSKKDRHRGNRHDTPSRYHRDILSTSYGDGFRRNDDSEPEDNKTMDMDRKPRREKFYQAEKNEEGTTDWDEKKEGAGKEDASFRNLDSRGEEDDQQHFQKPLKPQHLDMAAKLEKRKERFKLPMVEDKELIRRLDSENNEQLDKAEVKQERPARKRRWGSG